MQTIIGLCRFSFVGRGDWVAYRGTNVDQNDTALSESIANELYQDTRLEKRFFVFENFLLRSLDMQSDQDFKLLILTSKIMPLKYQNRLVEICKNREYTVPIFSDAADVNSGFENEIENVRQENGPRVVQFRIDDDDGLANDYIERLRRAAVAMNDYPNFTYGRRRGLVATLYQDQPKRYYRMNQIFHAAGCACRLNRRNMTIFSYGHFALRDRFPALIDNSNEGHLALKMHGHGSKPINYAGGRLDDHQEITASEYQKLSVDRFPHLRLDSLSGHQNLK